MKFYTRFDVAEKVVRPLSLEDNVDRLSYVDNTLMVKRLILEGKNLAIYRASALKAGLYSGDEALKEESGLATPVYEQDPVIVSEILKGIPKKSDSDKDEASSKDAAESDLSKEDTEEIGSSVAGPAEVQEAAS